MRIKLVYDGSDGPYGGYYENVITLFGDASDALIERRLLPWRMGIPFDDDTCSYEILKFEKEVVSI